MTRMAFRVPSIAMAFTLAAVSASAIEMQVTTDKPVYYQGEQIRILLTVTTPGTLNFYNLPQTYYILDGSQPSTEVVLPVLSTVIVPPAGYTWSMTHNWKALPLSVGVHSVTGVLMGYGTSASSSFTVVEPPPPQGNFLVDFETIPGTGAPLADLVAYDDIGVHFHTALGAACTLHHAGANSWVEGFDPYPAGFNVAVTFDRPIYGASAQVAGATGGRISLVAKNGAGQTLASSTTPPISQPGQFVQTLSVFAGEPIAALEWRPDMSNSMCAVDNLFLATDPRWPSAAPPPVLSGVIPQPGGSLRLQAEGAGTFSYTLQVSSDLANWVALTNLITRSDGSLDFLDQAAVGQTVRFYRLTCP